MKRFLLIIAIAFTAAVSHAQTISAPVDLKSSPTRKYARDTTSGTTPKYQYTQVLGYQSFITEATAITKISGTVAGSLKLEGSLDNITYFPIGSAYTITDVASQSVSFSNTPHVWLWYRVNVTLTGGVVSFVSNAIWRKPS